MPEALSDARWAAIRGLREGTALPTNECVAEASGVYVKTIARRASDEGWKVLDFRHKRVGAAYHAMMQLAAHVRAGEELDPAGELDETDEDAASGGLEGWIGAGEAKELAPLADLPPAERVARIGAMLTRRTETLLQRVEAGRPIESRQVAALASLVQLSERIAVLAREDEKQELRKGDDELAAILARVNDRIIYLARELAARLVRQTLSEQGMGEAEISAALARYKPASPARGRGTSKGKSGP